MLNKINIQNPLYNEITIKDKHINNHLQRSLKTNLTETMQEDHNMLS